ncbi:hypothetical protein ACVW0P_000769 [Mucilaginibacter sp. UYNi724]
MNKFFTTLIAVCVISTASFSQTKGTNQFGIQVGYNATTVTASGYTNTDYRSGFNAGIVMDHYFSNSWSIKTKALYDQKGWNSGYISSPSGSFTTNYQVDYVTVPIMANWHFGRTKNWYLNFGPYVGVLLNAKESAGGTDFKDYFNSTDVGLDLGIGVKFPVTNTSRFFIELNGAGGITDMVKNNTGPALRNSASSVNIGFAF